VSESGFKSKPSLNSDETPSLIIARVPLSYKAWDGINCAGPLPTLFSLDPTEASTRLKAFPEATHAAMQLLAGKLTDIEPLNNAQEAMAFLKDGWQPKIRRPFVREWVKEPLSKKKPGDHSPINPVGDSSGKFSSRKYGNNIPNCILTLISASLLAPSVENSLNQASLELVAASIAKSTWKKYGSAWNSFLTFSACYDTPVTLPLSIYSIRAYVTWCISVKNLKPTSVKSYLSGLNFISSLASTEKVNFFSDKIVNLLLTGAENSLVYKDTFSKKRLSLNLDTMLYLGHKIASSNLSSVCKQMIWTAATLAFFTCARMGELLPCEEKNYDVETTLCWRNVKFVNSSEILIFLPFTKTKKTKGEFVDLFSFKICCPVAALKNWYKVCSLNGKNISMEPVFSHENSFPLNTRTMNEYLSKLLSDITPENCFFSCHSFRSAIPSIISNYPDQAFIADIKEWGRWESNSYQIYMKLEREKRRKLFSKISKILSASSKFSCNS